MTKKQHDKINNDVNKLLNGEKIKGFNRLWYKNTYKRAGKFKKQTRIYK